MNWLGNFLTTLAEGDDDCNDGGCSTKLKACKCAILFMRSQNEHSRDKRIALALLSQSHHSHSTHTRCASASARILFKIARRRSDLAKSSAPILVSLVCAHTHTVRCAYRTCAGCVAVFPCAAAKQRWRACARIYLFNRV